MRLKVMIIRCFITFCLILMTAVLQVARPQEAPLLLDHPGKFEIVRRTDYTLQGSGFTMVEIKANLERITELVTILRKNPVLSEMKGFEGRAGIYTIGVRDNIGYGIPSRILIQISSWFRTNKGTPGFNMIEPPEWSLFLNKTVPNFGFCSDMFSMKHGFFTVPENKKTLEPGIDVYAEECYVVYRKDHPDYWIPVTVKEAFDVVFEETRKIPDQVQRDFMLKFLNSEWEAIPKESWDKPATFSGSVSRVGIQSGFPLIMKVNPHYWDKGRPKSDIQFIYFRMVGNKDYLRAQAAEYLRQNSTSYHLALFQESLDINMVRSLLPLVGN